MEITFEIIQSCNSGSGIAKPKENPKKKIIGLNFFFKYQKLIREMVFQIQVCCI